MRCVDPAHGPGVVAGLVLIAACGFLHGSAIASPQQAAAGHSRRDFPAQDHTILPFANADAALEFLRSATVVHSERLGSGSTHPLRLTLEAGAVRAGAIFRDIEINRDRVKLPDGTDFVQFFDRAIHEVAAFEVAKALGIGAMVPPVVERRIDGNRGTLQLWIEGAMTEAERNRRGLAPPTVAVWQHQQADMRVFDALIANSDRNTGNSLIDEHWNLWLIDHTRAFQRPRRALATERLGRVSAHMLAALRALDRDTLGSSLDNYLEGPQIASLLARQRRIVEHFDRLIASRGIGAVVIR